MLHDVEFPGEDHRLIMPFSASRVLWQVRPVGVEENIPGPVGLGRAIELGIAIL